MYGCDWGKSLPSHARIMAVQMKRAGFDEILRIYTHNVETRLLTGDVAVEWKPDNSPIGRQYQGFSIRIGIRGNVTKLFKTDWVQKMTDITHFVSCQSVCVQKGHLRCIWIPYEKHYIPVSYDICRMLGIKYGGELTTKSKPLREMDPTLNSSELYFSASRPREVILYLYGAFNPIHTGHIKALEACKNWLENTKKVCVCATSIGIMSDTALESKVAKIGDFCLSFNHRKNLCEIVCSSYQWIHVWPISVKGQVAFGNDLRIALNKPDATLGIIMGSDRAVQPRYSFKRVLERNTIILCVGRDGMSAADNMLFTEAMETEPMQPRGFYVVPTTVNGISSTGIRKKLQQIIEYYTDDLNKRSNMSVIVDDLIELGWITVEEGEYISRHFYDFQVPEEDQIFATCSEVQLKRRQLENHK